MKNFYFLLFSLGLWSAGTLKAEEAVIEFTTEPAMDKILPDAETAKLKFAVKNKKGELIKKALLRVKLEAPQTTAFFSTDFPIVEGTPLMDLEMEVNNGQAEFEYLLPIRGTYNLEVTATSSGKRQLAPSPHAAKLGTSNGYSGLLKASMRQAPADAPASTVPRSIRPASTTARSRPANTIQRGPLAGPTNARTVSGPIPRSRMWRRAAAPAR